MPRRRPRVRARTVPMRSCDACDHGWIEVDGAYARCDHGETTEPEPDPAPAAEQPPLLDVPDDPIATIIEVANRMTDRRAEVLRAVARAGSRGATCDELEATHHWTHQSASATLNWLERHGAVLRLSTTRPTRSGSNASPYATTSLGDAVLDTRTRR